MQWLVVDIYLRRKDSLKNYKDAIRTKMENKFTFKRLNLTDLPLMHGWFNQPHIQKFYSLREWSEQEVFEKLKPCILGRKAVSGFIVLMDEIPIGYIQQYKIKDFPWPNQKLSARILNQAAGIDMFIGDEKLIGKGLGAQLIKAFIKEQIWPQFHYCLVDPDIKNISAIKCYEKLKFQTYTILDTENALGEPVKLQLMMLSKEEEDESRQRLGLPLDYQEMPEYFDAHNINEKTDAKNALIEKLLKEQKVQTVLDMTCGTGSQVFYLAERGYEVIGSDFSPALLEQARMKAKKLHRQLHFIDGDMRNIKVGQFDAVITIFNAIGHLTQIDFEKALKNIRTNLKEGGVYIFDIFNLEAMTDDVLDSFSMDVLSIVEGVKIRSIQHSELDKENGFLISHDHHTLYKEQGEPEIHTNTFSLQIYTAAELRSILLRNGFEVISQYDLDGNHFVADKSLNILTVAKAKET